MVTVQSCTKTSEELPGRGPKASAVRGRNEKRLSLRLSVWDSLGLIIVGSTLISFPLVGGLDWWFGGLAVWWLRRGFDSSRVIKVASN